jgi:hypothetical protein
MAHPNEHQQQTRHAVIDQEMDMGEKQRTNLNPVVHFYFIRRVSMKIFHGLTRTIICDMMEGLNCRDSRLLRNPASF